MQQFHEGSGTICVFIHFPFNRALRNTNIGRICLPFKALMIYLHPVQHGGLAAYSIRKFLLKGLELPIIFLTKSIYEGAI